MLVTACVLVMFPAAAWGLVYVILGEPVSGWIPGAYSILTAANLFVFARTRRYRLFRASQLIFFLFLPFLLQISLGGFVGASAVILWALLAPLGALVMQGRSAAIRYMVGYAGLLIVSILIEPSLTIDNSLSPAVVRILFVLNLLFVSGIAFIMLNYFIGQRDRAQEKADDLLLNILPEGVAADLKEHGSTAARHFAGASVMFADLVGFTEYAESVEPEEMIRTLEAVFTQFDAIAFKHGVEKIRTIGDSYMAVSGVPEERPDHATAIARAALEMMEYVECSADVAFRIGINSGPLVAGVVGSTKFQYDIWGDTVNTASRMESSGVAGRIQVSGSTHALIADRFDCVPRGEIEVKGKGVMSTWFVERERMPAGGGAGSD